MLSIEKGNRVEKISRFEQLIAWQKARGLTRAVYKITRKPRFLRDIDLCRQLRRSVISIMSNIAEGFERGGRAEFHQFLSIAKASCAEVRSQLYIAKDADYLSDDEFHELITSAEEVGRIIGGLRVAIAKQRDRQ